MRTLADNLANGLLSQSPNYYKRAELHYRYWQTDHWAWGGPIDVSDDIVDVTPLKWKFDADYYGQFSAANCTCTFQNNRNQWKSGNVFGHIWDTRVLNGSQIKLVCGTIDPDGTENPLYIFTGYILSEPIYNPDGKTVDIQLSGRISILENTSAELVSIAVTDEVLGADSGTAFVTANVATGIIVEVKKGSTVGGAGAATALLESKDFSITNLNNHDAGATITLEEALVAGQSLWVTYKYWYTDKTIEWIVSELCTAAGVTATDISPAQFENDVKTTFSQSDAADFDLGTDTDTDHSTGDVLIATTFPRTTLSSYTDGGGYYYYAQVLSEGTWQVLYPLIPGGSSTEHFISDTGNPATSSGYALKITQSGTTIGQSSIILYRYDSGTPTVLYSGGALPVSNGVAVRISRDSSGVFRVWVYVGLSPQWVSLGAIATDTTYSTSAYWATNILPSAFYSRRIDDEIATGSGSYVQTGNYVTPEIDGTASLTSWGKLVTSEAKPAGTSTVLEWREKDSGGSFGAWTAVNGDGTIGAVKQIIQLRWTAFADTTQTLSPTLAEWSIDYFTSQITIPVVNLTGLSCKSAIEEMANMCAYQMGFNAVDTFIFKPRSSTVSPAFTFDNSNIIELSKITDGSERVYNSIDVSFGIYNKHIDSVTNGDAQPNSIDIFGTKSFSFSSANLLPAENVDLAYAIAPTIYNYTAPARRRILLASKFALALELGDAVTLNVEEPDVIRLWRWGDGDVQYGQNNIVYYSDIDSVVPNMLSLYGVTARVEGVEFDIMSWKTTFDLVEVL